MYAVLRRRPCVRLCPSETSLTLPAVRTQEPPDALAALVLPAEHGGCLQRAGAAIRQSPPLPFSHWRNRRGSERRRLHAVTKESGHCDPRHGSGAGAGGCPGAAWRSRWPEEEGQEWAQTAAEAAGTGTTSRVEDADAERASTGLEEQEAPWTG